MYTNLLLRTKRKEKWPAYSPESNIKNSGAFWGENSSLLKKPLKSQSVSSLNSEDVALEVWPRMSFRTIETLYSSVPTRKLQNEILSLLFWLTPIFQK